MVSIAKIHSSYFYSKDRSIQPQYEDGGFNRSWYVTILGIWLRVAETREVMSRFLVCCLWSGFWETEINLKSRVEK